MVRAILSFQIKDRKVSEYKGAIENHNIFGEKLIELFLFIWN